MIASDDIGAFAALALGNPDEYLSEAVEIAGDELTEPQIVGFISEFMGREVNLTQPDTPSPYKDFVQMVDWFNHNGFQSDIPALRSKLPGLKDLRGWLESNRWGG